MEKVALEKPQTAGESTASENATTESTARKTDDSGRTSASDEARADHGKATGSSEDDHRQGARAKLCREVSASTGRQGHCKLVDRGEEGTSAGWSSDGRRGEIDEMESRVR